MRLCASACPAPGCIVPCLPWIKTQPRLPLPKDAFVLTVYEMLFGSFWLLAFAALRGEHVLPVSAPLDAWLAWAYLVMFGSVVAFTAYVWVLSVAPISLVATYAYVNPVVAVFLGWLVLSEPVTLPIVLGGGIVVAAVAIVVSAERRSNRASPERPAIRTGNRTGDVRITS